MKTPTIDGPDAMHHALYCQHLGAALRLTRLGVQTGADWSSVIRYHASLAAWYILPATAIRNPS